MNTMSKVPDQKIEPARDMKHINIDHAIERLAEVNFQCSRLLDKIVGGGASPEPEPVSSAIPSLLEILNQGGNRIAEQAEQISSKIAELEALLF